MKWLDAVYVTLNIDFVHLPNFLNYNCNSNSSLLRSNSDDLYIPRK